MADECFIPGTSRITEIESYHRYWAAAELCKGCSVLDAASGEGYGAAILASCAANVTGVDLNREIVEKASLKYVAENLSYVHADVAALPFADNSFDRVVSFETIEHIPDQNKFLSEVRRVLKPDGVLILSSPNKTPFRERNKGENAWHIQELEHEALRELLLQYFPEINFYQQDAFYNSVINADNSNSPFWYVKDLETNIIKQRVLEQVQYTILTASASTPPVMDSSYFLDAFFDPKRGYLLDDEAVVNQFGLRGDYEKLREELAEGELTRQILADENSSLIAKNREAQEKFEQLEASNAAIYTELQNKTWENGELKKSVEELQTEKTQLFNELQEKSREGEAQQTVIADLQQQTEHLRQAYQEKAAENAEQQKNIAEVREINQKLQNISENFEKANAQIYLELQNKTWENGELKKSVEELQTENIHLGNELQEKSHESEVRQTVIADLQLKTEHLRQECQEKTVENAEQQKNIAEIREINQKLLKISENFEKANTQIYSELQNKTLENVELKKRVEEFQSEKTLLFNELQEKSREGEALQKVITDLQEKSDQLTRECLTASEECEILRRMITELEEINHKLIEKKNMMGRENEVLAANIAEKQGELLQAQENLQNLSRELEQLKADFAKAQETIVARDEQIISLRVECEKEHAKAEYLYGEYLQLKDSLALRLLGRWGLRKKAQAFVCRTVVGMYKVGRCVFRMLPGSYSKKMAFRDKIYGHCGNFLWSVAGYEEWHLHYAAQKALEFEKDTGLIVPPDIPMTSIIIPVYNNIKLTRRCLHSIYNVKSISPFEVIVVDDCSTEDYESLKKDFPAVRIIRNEQNSGFLLTVNRGAKEAQGEYILILNNDTEVIPGWLDELTCALYRHPEAGMIGSQLVHLRTGTLQESGNLICKNGDMMPLGRGELPDHPQFSYFREVDFCSAASIILRKKVFLDEMGGFDRVYVPAYFEDPDLGLRLKKAGYKNYVCPLSRVLHVEMASYGETLDEKCAKNRAVLMERWRGYLEENAIYRDREEPKKCMKFSPKRILYIDAETPMADRGSGGMDAIFFMEYMIKRGYEVVFHGEYTPGYVSKYTTILLRMGVECVYEPQRKIWEYLEVAGWTFSHIFVSRIYQARCFDRLLKKYCPQAAYIFDTVDVHFVREELEAELKNDDTLRKLAADTKKYELAAAGAADATIVISSDEKKLLENDYHLTNVYHIPQARELFGLAHNPKRRGAVFIGSAHPPNLDGLRYFHDEILPLLPADFRLTIIGEALRMMIGKSAEYKKLLKCPQFNFVGFVQDLGTELNNAKITIAPLRYGAGTKGKVASSMSYGVPCVSSGFGTEGTGMVHGENIMIANTPEEFAEYINLLFNDQELWQRISDGGIKFIRDNYAPEKVEMMMDSLFADVDKRRREQRSTWASTPVMPKVDEV